MKFSYPSGSKPLEGYTIKRGIGIGGFGEVYFALSDAGKEVALKKIQRNLDVELRGVRQCLNLKHVNLISLWDIRCSQHGESWVVMEYVPGPSLRDVVEANAEGMPEEQVKSWFTSTASGVAYLHEHGIVHRDLKPGNIFCDEDEQVIKIGDYGLSKFISCSRRSGQTESVGTFHYMAPEIGKGVYGKEIDIYALGIILYEMLTGLVPFEGESTQEIIMKHLTADPDVQVVPAGFQQVIAKSLRKDPELRYRSVPEMVAELPWPDIAANSQKIISQHAVGPMVLGSHSTRTAKKSTDEHPGLVRKVNTDPVQPVVKPPKKLPPVIISGKEVEVVPDIVFGPLTDNSHYQATSKSPQPPSRPQRTSGIHQMSAAIRIDDDEVAATNGAVSESAAVSVSGGSSEPIASAVQTGFGRVHQWWNNANVSTPVKIILLIVAGVVVVQNSQWLLPLIIGLGFAYLVYYLGRTWYANSSPSESKLRPRELERQKQTRVRRWLGERPASDRATELVGSMLVAALACIVLNLLGFAVGTGLQGPGVLMGDGLSSSVERWAVYTWLTLNCVVASWSILVVSKPMETKEGNQWLRRAVMVAVGLVVGAIAFFSAGSFEINLSDLALSDVQSNTSSPLVLRGIPIFPAYLIFFAGLFGILRWWRQADPVRKTRLSILTVTLSLIWATVFSYLLDVPLTGNCILAVVLSISVQLASPWLHPANREEIRSVHDTHVAS